MSFSGACAVIQHPPLFLSVLQQLLLLFLNGVFVMFCGAIGILQTIFLRLRNARG
jgi:hypothetical protein